MLFWLTANCFIWSTYTDTELVTLLPRIRCMTLPIQSPMQGSSQLQECDSNTILDGISGRTTLKMLSCFDSTLITLKWRHSQQLPSEQFYLPTANCMAYILTAQDQQFLMESIHLTCSLPLLRPNWNRLPLTSAFRMVSSRYLSMMLHLTLKTVPVLRISLSLKSKSTLSRLLLSTCTTCHFI